jgi:hypothetical protein
MRLPVLLIGGMNLIARQMLALSKFIYPEAV